MITAPHSTLNRVRTDVNVNATYAYARMPADGFDRVLAASGFLGRPHGSRVAMGLSLVSLSKSADHEAFFKALGGEMRKFLKSGMSVGQKAGVVVAKSDESEREAFIEAIPEDDLGALAQMIMTKLGLTAEPTKVAPSKGKGKKT
jgi:hypothetical protein|tara:strand:- start:745 stop:1179 length:435 start_codon:yes stop_codon:yes gene_type:complete